MQTLLPILISPKQARFVERQQILDDIILVHETIQSLKVTKKSGMLIKLDIFKAYEKISWKYMEKMLEAFGFEEYWESWVMNLVTTPFFLI